MKKIKYFYFLMFFCGGGAVSGDLISSGAKLCCHPDYDLSSACLYPTWELYTYFSYFSYYYDTQSVSGGTTHLTNCRIAGGACVGRNYVSSDGCRPCPGTSTPFYSDNNDNGYKDSRHTYKFCPYCLDGSYGSFNTSPESVNIHATCFKCPNNGKSDSEASYNDKITDCYMPYDSVDIDTSGNFVYKTPCNWVGADPNVPD